MLLRTLAAITILLIGSAAYPREPRQPAQQKAKDEPVVRIEKREAQVASRPQIPNRITQSSKVEKADRIPAAAPHSRMKSEMRYLMTSLDKMARQARVEPRDAGGKDIREGPSHGRGR